jgi:hypothetical protein
MFRYALIAALAIAVLAGMSCARQRSKPTSVPAGPTALEYEIYSMLVDLRSIVGTGYPRGNAKLVVIQGRTSTRDLDRLGKRAFEELSKRLPGLSRETFDEFVARNKQHYPLRNRFHVKVKCAFISEKELDSIFDEGGGWWPEFYRRYPESQGILTLSRVGFNRAKDQALVCVGDDWGNLAGAGYCVLVVRKKAAWRVRGTVGLWVS